MMMTQMKADMKPDERARWINQNTDYVYVGAGLKMFTIPNPAQRILAHEKFELARNGIVNVLYVDGHVEAQAAAYVRQQVEEQKKAK
jgi:prepilin-type processing-associated H-X9-DG protein